MKLKFTILSLFLASTFCFGQKTKFPRADSLQNETDSVVANITQEIQTDNIADVSLDESDGNGGSNQSAASNSLVNNRDPFLSATIYNFGTARFRYRGYTNDFNSTYMNGLTMQTLENGSASWGQWGGLNGVTTRGRSSAFGLTPTTFGYGNIGSTTNIDTRPSKQYRQTQARYSFSNRNYSHSVSLSHATGMSKKGWAFAFAGSFRGADEGYLAGTYANSYSYFAGVDKKIGDKHLVSLVGFGAPSESGFAGAGRQTPGRSAGVLPRRRSNQLREACDRARRRARRRRRDARNDDREGSRACAVATGKLEHVDSTPVSTRGG